MPNIKEIQILNGTAKLGSAPFGDYDKPTKSLQLQVIDWGATKADPLVGTSLTVKGTFIADGSAFLNDMKLVGLNKGGVAGAFKA